MFPARGWMFAVAATASVIALGVASSGPNAQATSALRPTVAIVGDSFSAGIGSDCGCQSQAWFQYTARDLGWRIGNVVADPGGAFQNPGAEGTLAQSLTAHPVPRDTDFVLVQGGLNDTMLDPAGEAAAVRHTLDVVRSQAPHATVIVIGAFFPFPDHLDSPHQIVVARLIGEPAAIGDTRYTAGVLCGFPVGPDGVHPTSEGHQIIGHWVADRLRHHLDSGRPLRRDPGGFWTT